MDVKLKNESANSYVHRIKLLSQCTINKKHIKLHNHFQTNTLISFINLCQYSLVRNK